MSSLTFPPEHESEMPRCEHGRAIESACEFCDDEKIESLEARVAELQELDIQLRDRVVIAERDVRRLRQSIDGASEFDLRKARQSAGTACDEFRNQDARELASLLRDACDRISHLELDKSGNGGS